MKMLLCVISIALILLLAGIQDSSHLVKPSCVKSFKSAGIILSFSIEFYIVYSFWTVSSKIRLNFHIFCLISSFLLNYLVRFLCLHFWWAIMLRRQFPSLRIFCTTICVISCVRYNELVHFKDDINNNNKATQVYKYTRTHYERKFIIWMFNATPNKGHWRIYCLKDEDCMCWLLVNHSD